MTTIAQKILENSLAAPSHGEIPVILNMAVQLTRARLSTEMTLNTFEVVNVHGKDTSNSEAYRILTRLAERFMFQDENPGDVVYEHLDAGTLDQAAMFNNARMPVDNAWIEWRHRDSDGDALQFGALLDSSVNLELEEKEINGKRGGAVQILQKHYPNGEPSTFLSGIVYSAMAHTDATPIFTFTLSRGFVHPKSKLKITWQADCLKSVADQAMAYEAMYGYTVDETLDTFITTTLVDLAALLFLINTPKAVEQVEHRWPEKLQRARKKRNKIPLLEFRKILVRIGSPYVRNVYPRNLSQGATDARRRLHQVIGHFRTYTKHHEDKPLVAWVPQHWRGDATLGVVMHERTLKQD